MWSGKLGSDGSASLSPALALAFVLVWFHTAAACSPPVNYRPLTVFELFQKDAIKSVFLMYVYGGARLTADDKFGGFVDAGSQIDLNAPYNMLVYRGRALKGGCEFEDGSFAVLSSVPALCGLTIEERGWYLVGVTSSPRQKNKQSLPVYEIGGFVDTVAEYKSIGHDEFSFANSQVRTCGNEGGTCNNGKPIAACEIYVCAGCPSGRQAPQGWYCVQNYCLDESGCVPVAQWFDSKGRPKSLKCDPE